MKLVRVARSRLRFGDDARDRLRVERAQIALVRGEGPPERDGARPALLERGVVEERVRLRVQNLVRERRRLGRVAGVEADLAPLDPFEDPVEARRVHRLGQAVAHRLANERVIRDLDRARRVLLASDLRREHRGEEVLRPHPLEEGLDLLSSLEAEDCERARRVPAPARAEHRRDEDRLLDRRVELVGADEAEGVCEREALRRPDRENDRVVGRGGLELEVEADAKSLPEREPESAVHPRAEGGVDDELHSARFVEEPLEDDVVHRRDEAERVALRADVARDLIGPGGGERALAGEPGARVLRSGGGRGTRARRPGLGPRAGCGVGIEPHDDLRPEAAHLLGELPRSPRRLTEPERNVRRLPSRVLHPHHPTSRLDPANLPRVRAEDEDVPRHALDRPVLVDRAHQRLVRIEDDAVVGHVRDRTAVREGDDARRAPRAKNPVHAVVVEERTRATEARRGPLRERAHHLVEDGAAQRFERARLADEIEEPALVPLPRRALRHDLLGEHVERSDGRMDPIELPLRHAPDQRRALDELVARRREEAAARRPALGVARAADPLEERADDARRSDLADEVDRAHVDPELQRRRRDDGAHVARLQALLDHEAPLFREAPVVCPHALFPEPLGEVVGDPLRHPSRIDEDEGRPRFGDEGREAIVDLRPLLVRRDRFELRSRHFDPEVEVAPVPDVDDCAGKRAARQVPARRLTPDRAPDQEARRLFDRMNGRGETDPDRPPRRERVQARKREREMASALVAHQGVELIDDDRLHAPEDGPGAVGGQHQVERLGRRDQDVRDAAKDRRPRRGGRVAGAERGPDLRERKAELCGRRADPFQRRDEVPLHVAAERFQRGDVDDLDAFAIVVGRWVTPPHERVEAREEGRERLAGAGRSGDERVAPRLDLPPPTRLRRGGGVESAREPGANGGVKRRREGHDGTARALTASPRSPVDARGLVDPGSTAGVYARGRS